MARVSRWVHVETAGGFGGSRDGSCGLPDASVGAATGGSRGADAIGGRRGQCRGLRGLVSRGTVSPIRLICVVLLFEFLQVPRSGGPVTAHCQESTGRGLDGTHHPVRRTDSPWKTGLPNPCGRQWSHDPGSQARCQHGRDNTAGAMIVDLWEEPCEVSG